MRAHVAEHARLQARHGVEQGERRDLAARQDEVAEAEFEVDLAIDEALVDAFVAGAKKNGAVVEHAQHVLPHRLAGRREIDERRRHGIATIGANRGNGALERLDQQHHARTAAVRPVIDAGMRRIAEIAKLPQAHVDLLRLEGAPRHAVHEMRVEQLGEQGDDVEAHGGTQ